MHSAISPPQSTGTDRNAVGDSRTHAAVKALYLVSGAAAQLGVSGLQIQEAQWQALAQAAGHTNTVLAAHETEMQEAIEAFRRLSVLCDHLLERRATGLACSSTTWRALALAGREAYEYLTTF